METEHPYAVLERKIKDLESQTTPLRAQLDEGLTELRRLRALKKIVRHMAKRAKKHYANHLPDAYARVEQLVRRNDNPPEWAALVASAGLKGKRQWMEGFELIRPSDWETRDFILALGPDGSRADVAQQLVDMYTPQSHYPGVGWSNNPFEREPRIFFLSPAT